MVSSNWRDASRNTTGEYRSSGWRHQTNLRAVPANCAADPSGTLATATLPSPV